MTGPTIEDARKVLNSHGHAFQYAVLRRGEELSRQELTSWLFEAAEFPVGAPQSIIHIDFILRSQFRDTYLVAECKRADPAKANWCFLKVPYTRRNARENELVFQEVRCGPAIAVHARHHEVSASRIDSCHLGIEMRTSSQGDGTSGSGAAINSATTQVLRGLNGLVDYLYPSPTMSIRADQVIRFVPVIFTTAALWVVDGDLSLADLGTGRLPEDWGALKPVQWLWFNYNQSPSLRHQLPAPASPDHSDIPGALHAEYTRSIAVVGRDGIDTFLKTDLASWL